MRLILAALLLAFAVFFTSIELSSQSSNNRSSQGSRISNQRANSGEPSISNKHEHSQDSANSRISRRLSQQVEDSRNSASSNRRQQNANHARSGNERSSSSLVGYQDASSSHPQGGHPGHFQQQQGHLGQQGQQHQSDSSFHYSYISYSLPSSPSVPLSGSSSPRGPLSFHYDFNTDGSESGSNHVSPRHHHP